MPLPIVFKICCFTNQQNFVCILCSCDGNVYLHWLYIDGLSDFVKINYQNILDVVFILTIQSVLAVFTHFSLFS